jgi:hypothetical protein
LLHFLYLLMLAPGNNCLNVIRLISFLLLLLLGQ